MLSYILSALICCLFVLCGGAIVCVTALCGTTAKCAAGCAAICWWAAQKAWRCLLLVAECKLRLRLPVNQPRSPALLETKKSRPIVSHQGEVRQLPSSRQPGFRPQTSRPPVLRRTVMRQPVTRQPVPQPPPSWRPVSRRNVGSRPPVLQPPASRLVLPPLVPRQSQALWQPGSSLLTSLRAMMMRPPVLGTLVPQPPQALRAPVPVRASNVTVVLRVCQPMSTQLPVLRLVMSFQMPALRRPAMLRRLPLPQTMEPVSTAGTAEDVDADVNSAGAME
ncbi:hypothetical protein IWW57_003027, partial [Coemansia sp. S610]